MIKDQFDAAATWLVTHLATWETLRHGFSIVESPEDHLARIGIIATFLRHDFWNQPDGSLPRFGQPFAIPLLVENQTGN